MTYTACSTRGRAQCSSWPAGAGAPPRVGHCGGRRALAAAGQAVLAVPARGGTARSREEARAWRRRQMASSPGRNVPGGAAGVLLPDARLGSRRRGLVQDTYLRACEGGSSTTRLAAHFHRALPGRDERLPHHLGCSRPLPSGPVAATDPLEPLVRGDNVAWLQPLPNSFLDAGDPAGAAVDRCSVRLAFAAALQHLSARQRGALILGDAVSFSASEAADILGTTVVSVARACLPCWRSRWRRRRCPALHRWGCPLRGAHSTLSAASVLGANHAWSCQERSPRRSGSTSGIERRPASAGGTGGRRRGRR